MKILVIYASIHHGNTKKIADTIHKELGGKLISFTEVSKEEVLEADLVGFGSGIYMAKFHKGLIKFVSSLPKVRNKKAFIFSTAGMTQNIFLNRGHKNIRKILNEKGFQIIDEFDCLGYDSFGPLKVFGGVNKGRPDKTDLEEARKFAKKLKNNQEKVAD